MILNKILGIGFEPQPKVAGLVIPATTNENSELLVLFQGIYIIV